MFLILFLIALLLIGIPLGIGVLAGCLALMASHRTGWSGVIGGPVLFLCYIALWCWGAAQVYYLAIQL